MQRSVFAVVAAVALEHLQLARDARALVVGNGASVAGARPPLDALLCVEPCRPLRFTQLARVLAPEGWIALAALDPANRFHAALAEALGGAYEDAPFCRLAALAGTLESNGFTDVEVVGASEELRVLPTQDWLLRNAVTPALADKAPFERAALLRELAARLKDLWYEDAFRVPVAIRCVYARKRRIAS